MSQTQLLPSIFQRVHPKYRTPGGFDRHVLLGRGAGVGVCGLPSLSTAATKSYAQMFRGEDGLTFLGDLYAFGAAASYTLVFIALDRAAPEGPPQPARVSSCRSTSR